MAEWLCDSPRPASDGHHAWERADAWPRALRRTRPRVIRAVGPLVEHDSARLPLKLWVTVGRFSSQANTAPNTPVVVHGPRGPDAWWAAEQRLRHGVDESSDRGRGGRRNLDRGSRRSIVGGDRRGHAFVRNSRGDHIVRRDVSGRSRRGGQRRSNRVLRSSDGRPCRLYRSLQASEVRLQGCQMRWKGGVGILERSTASQSSRRPNLTMKSSGSWRRTEASMMPKYVARKSRIMATRANPRSRSAASSSAEQGTTTSSRWCAAALADASGAHTSGER